MRGLWGEDDELRCLNHLTPSRVAAVAKKIQSRASVRLSWTLNEMHVPPPFRIRFEHQISLLDHHINVRKDPKSGPGCDPVD